MQKLIKLGPLQYHINLNRTSIKIFKYLFIIVVGDFFFIWDLVAKINLNSFLSSETDTWHVDHFLAYIFINKYNLFVYYVNLSYLET